MSSRSLKKSRWSASIFKITATVGAKERKELQYSQLSRMMVSPRPTRYPAPSRGSVPPIITVGSRLRGHDDVGAHGGGGGLAVGARDAQEFSLSHSGRLTLCALSARPVGVDIEQIRPRGASLPRYALTAAEYARFQAGGTGPPFIPSGPGRRPGVSTQGRGCAASGARHRRRRGDSSGPMPARTGEPASGEEEPRRTSIGRRAAMKLPRDFITGIPARWPGSFWENIWCVCRTAPPGGADQRDRGLYRTGRQSLPRL